MRGRVRIARLELGAVALGAVAAAALACESPTGAPGSTVPESCTLAAPLVAANKTDILFVIDNSGSMADEQAGVASELPAFIDELRRGAGVEHDFRVGVITTSVYQQGETYREYPSESGHLQPVPLALPDGGVSPGPDRFLESSDEQLVERFARLVQVGTTGSGQETPFEAVRLAVASPLVETPVENGGNGGFLRDGARLLVVVVSDEDDCSELTRPPAIVLGRDPARDYCGENAAALAPVDYYADLLKSLTDSTGTDRPVMWAAIAPVARSDKRVAAEIDSTGTLRNVDCPTSFQPGHRQREMALRFDESLGNLDSICKGSWRESLLAIAQIANAAQTLDVSNVPDPRLLTAEVTRANGTVQTCSVASGELEYHAAENRSDWVQFTASCPRRADDVSVELKMFCAG